MITVDRDLRDLTFDRGLSQLVVDSWSLLLLFRVRRPFTNMAQGTAPAYRLSEDNVSEN